MGGSGIQLIKGSVDGHLSEDSLESMENYASNNRLIDAAIFNGTPGFAGISKLT
jgi:hypothetical protein